MEVFVDDDEVENEDNNATEPSWIQAGAPLLEERLIEEDPILESDQELIYLSQVLDFSTTG